jgi:hypothetical protein
MPADRKWAMRALVAQAISNTIRGLDLRYPPVDDAKREAIRQAKEKLQGEAAVTPRGWWSGNVRRS